MPIFVDRTQTARPIKTIRKIVYALIGIPLCLYICIILSLNIPYIQRQVSHVVSTELSDYLGSELTVGRIDLGLFNRFLIENLVLMDQKGQKMLSVAKFSAKFDLLPLLQRRISIRTVQLFTFDINVERPTPQSDSNLQFVLDAFASRDSVKRQTNLNMRINSLLIRRGRLTYNVLSATETPSRFNSNHVNLKDITATISLKALNQDSINAIIRNMRVEETNSKLALKNLSLHLRGSNGGMSIENFKIGLTNTNLSMDTIRLEFDSLRTLGRDIYDARFSFHLLPSKVILQDFAPFVPLFSTFTEPVEVELDTRGKINDFECKKLSISSGNHFLLSGQASFLNMSYGLESTLMFGSVDRVYADPVGVAFFVRNFSKEYTGVPKALANIGTVSVRGGQFSGYLSEPIAYLKINTDLGMISTDLHISTDRDRGYFAYDGELKTSDFQLGAMLGNTKLGNLTLNVGVDGSHLRGRYPTVKMIGNVAAFEYSGYTYKNIILNGTYDKGGLDGEASLDDPNVSLYLKGNLNAVAQVPTFDFLAEVRNFRPNELHITDQYPDTEISVNLRADFTGGNIDDLMGEINVDSLSYRTAYSRHYMDNLRLTAEQLGEGRKRLALHSPFVNGQIEGHYSYQTLALSVRNILRRYLPSLMLADSEEPMESTNNFGIDLRVSNTDLLADVLHIPLSIAKPATLKGYLNDASQCVSLEGHIPFLVYRNKIYESATFICENPDDAIHASLRVNNRRNEDAINVAMDVQAKADSLQALVNWGNNGAATYSGQLAAVAHFLRQELAEADEMHGHREQPSALRSNRKKKVQAEAPVPALLTAIDIRPTRVILSDTVWQIHPSQVVIDSGRVYVDNFGFSHENRHLRIHGTVSDQPKDTLHADLSSINIGYIFDIANLGVNLRGEATGPVFAAGILGNPFMRTDLHIVHFGINDGLLGNADIRGEWHNEVRGIYLDAHIEEPELSRTDAHGYIYPVKPNKGLDLQIEANNTNLKFINYYINNITSDFGGRATGHVNLYGPFKALEMNGRMLANAWMKMDMLGTTYHVSDSIYIVPDGLTFPGNAIADRNGNKGKMSGQVRYDHFRNASYDFRFQADKMLVMDTKESADFPFYGKVYGSGDVSVQGNLQDGANIDIVLTTEQKTDFTYIKDFVTTATSDQFIQFIDKTPRRREQDSTSLFLHEQVQGQKKAKVEEARTTFRLNLLIDATTDANMTIIMDPTTGDKLTARGSGNIRADYYSKNDEFNMFGTYTISQGTYRFNLQDIIRREFSIQDGSTIAFSGNPYEATMDISAIYTVNSASLNDLMSNASNYVDQTNVKVQCVMNLSGQLTAPELSFSLELPNERDEVQALVRNYIPTDEQMNMQILYLLSIGKFYTPENVSTTQNSDMMSSVLSSTLSGQLNNALSHVINSNNWNIGTNISTGEEGWTDMEFETVLSGQLLNNRLLVNGNFGYRDNPAANTNFVGDFEAEWLVIRSGDIRLKAYNETNDRYYTKTNLTTQGVGIIFRKDFDKWSELMFWNRWKWLRAFRKSDEGTPVADTADSSEEGSQGDAPATDSGSTADDAE